MRLVKPLDSKTPVVLTALFPFTHSKMTDALLGAHLKIECLIQDQCTIPGSMVIADPVLRTLVRNNAYLLSEGVLAVDLRDSASSFVDLVQLKYGGHASREMWEMAAFLDDNSAMALHYNAPETAKIHKARVLSFLRFLTASSRAKSRKRLLEAAIRKVESVSVGDSFGVDDLVTGIPDLDRRLRALVQLSYCTCGAEVLNGVAQVPHGLWMAAHRSVDAPVVPPKEVGYQADLSFAHNIVLEYFALSPQFLNRLAAQDVVELRQDGATRRAIANLKELVAEEVRYLENPVLSNSQRLKDMEEARKLLHARIFEYCQKQSSKRLKSEIAGMSVDDMIGEVISPRNWNVPFTQLIRKAALRVGRAASRWSPKLTHLDATIAPLDTYVIRLHNKITARANLPQSAPDFRRSA
ncbi:MAG TPA: hypothetical protein VMF90_16290 [Rhizobiaceae bacterium]|nr:hypothetical protein [Rhizobiaceae bacterium]